MKRAIETPNGGARSARGVLAVFAALLTLAGAASAQTMRMEFSGKPLLVNCDPWADVPCFRLKANFLDAQGSPVGPQLPPPETLHEQITVFANGERVTPFCAFAIGEDAEQRGRLAMLLMDISGSMLQRMPSGRTRFEAAQDAARTFLDGFEDGRDQVAVVPFESHQVVSRIRSAVFAETLEAARAQVDALPAPEVQNNTALYSAVDTAIDVLRSQQAAEESEVMLIVMTDGRNDVQAGDDPGLMTEVGALPDKVARSAIQLIAIGLGDERSLDVEAMRQISTRTYLVADEATLSQVFSFARKLLLNSLQVSFASPWGDLQSLAGRQVNVQMIVRLPSGEEVRSNQTAWTPPPMGSVLYEGECDVQESRCAQRLTGVGPGGVWPVLRPVLVFTGLGALLMVMWFWIPRLVWAEQYAGHEPVRPSRPGRWSSETRHTRAGEYGPGAGSAPRGFTQAGKRRGPPDRQLDDRTVVRPQGPSGRTRLGDR